LVTGLETDSVASVVHDVMGEYFGISRIFSEPRRDAEKRLPTCNFQDPMVVAVGDIEGARAINIDTVGAIELGL
jgi:hypothetical protein